MQSLNTLPSPLVKPIPTSPKRPGALSYAQAVQVSKDQVGQLSGNLGLMSLSSPMKKSIKKVDGIPFRSIVLDTDDNRPKSEPIPNGSASSNSNSPQTPRKSPENTLAPRDLSVLRSSSAPVFNRFRSFPSFASLQVKKEKVQDRIKDYKECLFWIQKGKISNYNVPFPFFKLRITDQFLQTEYGEKTLDAAKKYLTKKNDSTKPRDFLCNQKPYQGTCLGQSYTALISYMKQSSSSDEINLFKYLDIPTVLFFQSVEVMMTRGFGDILFDNNTVTIQCDKELEEIAFKEIYDQTGLKMVHKRTFDLQLRDMLEAAVDEMVYGDYVAVEVGMYGIKEGTKSQIINGHSFMIFLGKDLMFYNASCALSTYDSKESLAHDIVAYLSKAQKEKNPLRVITTQGFSSRKPEKPEGKV